MAFNAKETFEKDWTALEDVMGPIASDGAPDIYNAVTSYLDKIASQIEENKGNPDKIKELQSLALSITETYFVNTDANSDIAKLSDYMQSQLKAILGENADVKSEYPELAASHPDLVAQLEEITKPEPEPEKEPQIAYLEANAEEHQKYLSLSGNEERRAFVMNEFKEGKFSDLSHIEFFIDQLSKDELILTKDDDKAKLDTLFNDSLNGLAKRGETKAQTILNSHLRQTVLKAGMMPTGMAPTPDMLETKDRDLGLADALKNIEKAEKKDEFAQLIDEAQKEAIKRRFEGNNPDSRAYHTETFSDITNTVKAKQSELKWYQLGKKRQIRKALKGLMEEGYYGSRLDNNSFADISGYAGLRYWNNRTDRFEKNKRKLKEVMDLKKRDASLRWMSSNFLLKLETKASLLLGSSAKRLTKKLLKDSDKAKLDAFQAELAEEFSKLPEPTTKLQNRGYTTYKNYVDTLSKSFEEQKKLLDKQKDAAFKEQAKESSKAATKEADKFKKKLMEQVTKMQQELKKSLEKDPMYQAYVKVHGEKAAAEKFKIEEAITTDKVMDQILTAQGYTDEQKKEIKAKLGMEEKTPEEKKSENDQPTEENSKETDGKTEETTRQQTQVNVGSQEGQGKTVSDREGIVAFTVSEDNSRYDLVTTDADGKPRDPTSEEINAFVGSLPKDAKITLEDGFSSSVQQQLLDAMKAKGLEVTNEEEVRKNIERRQKEEEKEKAEAEAQKETNENTQGEQNKEGEQPSGEQEKPTEKAERAEEKTTESAEASSNPGSDKEKMSIEKVLGSALEGENSEAKLKLIAQIQSGQFGTKGDEYFAFQEEIRKTFGKGSDEAAFLGNLAAAKALDADYKAESEAVYESLRKDKTEGNVKTTNQRQAESLLAVKKVTDQFKDDKIDPNNPDFAKLNKKEQKLVTTICSARAQCKTPEERQKVEVSTIQKYTRAQEARSNQRKTVARKVDSNVLNQANSNNNQH